MQYTKEHKPGYVKNPVVVDGGKKPNPYPSKKPGKIIEHRVKPFRKPGQMNHEYTAADREAAKPLTREYGVGAMAKKKMAAALSGYMKNAGSKPNRTPQRMTQGTSGDAQVRIGKLQDTRNLAAMMRRQRMGG